MNINNQLPVIYEYRSTSKNPTQKVFNMNDTTEKHFRINKVTIYKDKKYTIEFNDYYNEIDYKSFLKIPFSKNEIIQIIKFCFTGKNEINGHLMNRGIKYVETTFTINNERYNIRIFSEHSYKTFLTKTTMLDNTTSSKAEEVIASCNSLKDYPDRISPYLKNMFNLPDKITLPQYMRLFFLGNEDALNRIISDKEYRKMTTTLMNYLINGLVKKCQQNQDLLFKLNLEIDEEYSFTNYMINFIEEKISKLKNREKIEIEEIKNHYKKEINKSVNKQISEIKRKINKLTEEKVKLNRYLKNLERIINPNSNNNENQLLLFDDKDNDLKENKDNLLVKINETKSNLNKINLNINYLNQNLEELIKEKKSIAMKYHQKIDDIIFEYQERMLQEKINLEEIMENQKKTYYEPLNINDPKAIKDKIIETLIKNINHYITKSKMEYEVTFDINYIPVFVKNNVSKYIDDFDNSKQVLLSLSFHLGLIRFFNKLDGILPSFLLLNISKKFLANITDIKNLIKEFSNNRVTDNKFQIITMCPLISKMTNK